jgi:hypothetical protein
MANYEHRINGIHSLTPNTGYVSDTNTNEYITIKPENRQIALPTGFNPVVAYVGDVNSQIITFLCPCKYDNHSL